MRAGFTLVEMLVVIAIIGILTGLLVPAVVVAMRHVKNSAIALELSQLDTACKAYKEKFGEYPPDFTDTSPTGAVARHIATAFPRYAGNWQTDITNVLSATTGLNSYTQLTPQTALVFWLGGIPDANGNLCGFAADPTNPFQIPANCASRIKPFYDFDLNRVSKTGGSLTYSYWPQNAVGGMKTGEIVYFRAENGNYTTDGGTLTSSFSNMKTFTDPQDSTGVVNPAVNMLISNTTWVNPSSFQIFSAGRDLKYGTPSGTGPLQFPTGGNYSDSTGYIYDNITNFSNGTLESAMP